MFSTTMFLKLQNFSGDSNGNLTGSYVLLPNKDTVLDPMAMANYGYVNITTPMVQNEDAVTSLNKALLASGKFGTLTEVE
jgi:hypothetical protein